MEERPFRAVYETSKNCALAPVVLDRDQLQEMQKNRDIPLLFSLSFSEPDFDECSCDGVRNPPHREYDDC